MSSPFQKSFLKKRGRLMANPISTLKSEGIVKNPKASTQKGVVTLSEKDLKKIKSASSEPAKEISYEGQGGKDYENRPEDAINPEGQGGKDYEAGDSPAQKAKSFGRKGHPSHMQAGADNSGNPNAASPEEYWRAHQQQSHHNSPKPEEKKKLKQ